MKTIAIYGESGSYTEQAAIGYFGTNTKRFYYKYISEVFDAVEKGVGYGIVPIENSIEGAVTQTYDQLLGLKLHVVGETVLRINHCLIANPGINLKDVRKVYSHPQALGQCKEYLQKIKAVTVPFYDTAASVKMLKDEKLKNAAAIGSAGAAAIYGMKVLAKDIETNKHNYTRFFVVSKNDLGRRCNKTSMVFNLRSHPGALYEDLGVFAKNKIDLTYIQSRPVIGKPWAYNFYVDFMGDKNDRNVKAMLASMRKLSKFVKVLGSYNKA